MSGAEFIANHMRTGLESSSLVVDLATGESEPIESIAAQVGTRGWRIVTVPWETSGAPQHADWASTPSVSAERYRRTSVERLAHELVHEAILAQLPRAGGARHVMS
jgi:hypothetical protein